MANDEIPEAVKAALQEIVSQRTGSLLKSSSRDFKRIQKEWQKSSKGSKVSHIVLPHDTPIQLAGATYVVPNWSEGAGSGLPNNETEAGQRNFTARTFAFYYAEDAGNLLRELASKASGGTTKSPQLELLSINEAGDRYDRLHVNCLAHLLADPDSASERLGGLLASAWKSQSVAGLESFLLSALVSKTIALGLKNDIDNLVAKIGHELPLYRNEKLNLFAIDFPGRVVTGVRQQTFHDVVDAYREATDNKWNAARSKFLSRQQTMTLSFDEVNWCSEGVGAVTALATDKAAAAVVAAARPAIVEAGAYIGGAVGSFFGPSGAIGGAMVGAATSPSVASFTLRALFGIAAGAAAKPTICGGQASAPSGTPQASPPPPPPPPSPSPAEPREPYHHEPGNSCGNFGNDPRDDPNIMVAYINPEKADLVGGGSLLPVIDKLIIKTGPCVPNPDFRELAGGGFVVFGALTQMLLIGDEMYAQWGLNAPLVNPGSAEKYEEKGFGIDLVELITQRGVTDPAPAEN